MLATEITGQGTVQLLVPGPPPGSQWDIRDGNRFDRVLLSLWSELCLPSSGVSSAQSSPEKKGNEPDLVPENKSLLIHCLVLRFSSMPGPV